MTESSLLPPNDDDDNEEIRALIQRLEELLSQVPPEQAEEFQAVVAQFRQVSFQGPIPPPHLLAQYGEVLPGLPERIVAMAELEQQLAHQRAMDRNSIFRELSRTDAQRTNRGMAVATLAVLAGVGIAGSLAALGAYWPAVGAFIADMTVPVAILISALIGRTRNRNGN